MPDIYGFESREFYNNIRKLQEKNKGSLSLFIGCEKCLYFFDGDSYRDCLCGWELSADICPAYDEKVRCLNGQVYGKRTGCNPPTNSTTGCEDCWEQHERYEKLGVSYES